MLKELTEPLLNRNSNISSSFTYPQKTLAGLRFDYELDNFIAISEDKLSELKSFPDELVSRYYKCEPISFWNKNCLKGIISRNKIRLQRRNYDLDLM